MLGALLLIGLPAGVRAQSFSVPWFVVAGGGGTATNGSLSMTGTFGQWDAAEQPLTNGLFSLSSGFWSFLAAPEVVPVPPVTNGSVLFGDTFSGSSVNSTNWTTNGFVVYETNGSVVVSNAVANNGGVLTSVPFALGNSTGLITITRDVLVHAGPDGIATNAPTNFLGELGIAIGGVAPFSVNYADWSYSDGVTYTNCNGFYLGRSNAVPNLITDQANVTNVLAPFMGDVWLTESLTYNPTNGVMQYFINNVALETNFNVGVLPAGGTPAMVLTFNAYGLGTGDYQTMSNLVVSQGPGLTNSTAILVLSGDLAFGNVTGASATNTLTVRNAGNSPLTISNIVYSSAAFGGNWTNAVLAAGGSTNLAVTFTAGGSNNYTGTLTVVSDATSGTGTYPVSAFVTTGNLELQVDISGNGTVSPKDGNKIFKSGTKISLKASPGSGSAFLGWSGSIVSSANPLVFNLTNSMVLQASFVASPFSNTVTGTYAGLVGTTNGVAEATSGLLKGLTVNAKGAYSGALLINGASHTLSGTFAASGQASNYITRTAKLGGPLTVEMTLDLTGTPAEITGTVSNNLTGAVSDLEAYRAAVLSGTGEYTMVLAPGDLGLTGVPPGYGYVLMSEKNGTLTLSGGLADGTTLSQTVPVVAGAEGNEVPVFDSLYANTGLLTGWLSLETGGAPAGNLDWIKPATAKALLYPGGFTNVVIGQGSTWVAPTKGAAAINLTGGLLSLSGGTLASNIEYEVTVTGSSLAKVNAAQPTNTLTGTINAKTGLLTVTFGNGDKKTTTAGKGAVLQDTTNAAGYFLDKTNSGLFLLQP